MHRLRPLPTYLQQRYHGWRATSYAENKAWFERLASEGQRPKVMMISCCDSRVQPTSIFGVEEGEFFVHRNIANLVPPYDPSGQYHGTPAAVEYAVTALNITQLIVMGHSECGGAKGCLDMCKGHAPALEAPDSLVGRWLDILRPQFPDISEISDEASQVVEMERKTVQVSIENLFTYPFVLERFEKGQLSLHGLRIDVGSGQLECYEPSTKSFQPI